MVNPGDVIILDAGTTLMQMAKSLAGISPLTVVTSALNIATEVGSFQDVSVIVVGGSLERKTISTHGSVAERFISELVGYKVFLGIHAIDPEAGLSDTSFEIVQLKQTIIKAAKQVIVLADSTKWGRVAFVKVAPISAIHTLVTDTNLPDDARDSVRKQGVNLIVA